MWILQCEDPHSQVKPSYCLVKGQSYLVGRLSADISFAQDQSLSRKHAVLTVDDKNKVCVTDQGSTYGTYVGDEAINKSGNSSQSQNGKITKPTKMQDNTRVRFGLRSTIFR